MSEFIIEEGIIIDSLEETIERLEHASGIKNIDFNDIADFIQTQKYTKFYLDRELNCVDPLEPKSVYLWVDTGFEDEKGNPIFISLIHKDEIFIGHFIGNSIYLKTPVIKFFPKNKKKIEINENKFRTKYARKVEEREIKHLTEQYKNKNTEENRPVINANKTIEKEPETEIARQIKALGFVGREIEDDEISESNLPSSEKKYWNNNLLEISEEVYKMLLINNWHSVNGLDRYIKVIGTRITQLIAQKKKEYYIINNIKSVVVNTGLLDKFGTDIKIMYRINLSYQYYIPYKILESKQDYVSEGYSKEQISQEILPINFFDDNKFFEPDIEDFDINPRSLYHIIEERRKRLPESVQALSEAQLATKINNELELGLKIQKRDHNYAKPSFSTLTGTISWMIPMRINREFIEEPELVLVLRKAKDFWEIKTILPYDDDTKDKIMCLSLYGHLW